MVKGSLNYSIYLLLWFIEENHVGLTIRVDCDRICDLWVNYSSKIQIRLFVVVFFLWISRWLDYCVTHAFSFFLLENGLHLLYLTRSAPNPKLLILHACPLLDPGQMVVRRPDEGLFPWGPIDPTLMGVFRLNLCCLFKPFCSLESLAKDQYANHLLRMVVLGKFNQHLSRAQH